MGFEASWVGEEEHPRMAGVVAHSGQKGTWMLDGKEGLHCDEWSGERSLEI